MYSRPIHLPRSRFIRPQKAVQQSKGFEAFAERLLGSVSRIRHSRLYRYQKLLPAIHRAAQDFGSLDDQQLKDTAQALGLALRRNDFHNADVARAFALVREASGRALGLQHFDSQLLGGLALLFGNIAEMQTGEGKTLTATLPAATAAIAGVNVHVVTVNDYLAQRDCEEMRCVYEFLGLSVGCVVQGMSVAERQRAYANDIVYCTNKELVFDYLKDQIAMPMGRHSLNLHAERLKSQQSATDNIIIRGLHFAIVDEADSIFMDEAVTPLIISSSTQPNEAEQAVYGQALAIARQLREDEHYSIDTLDRRILLLPEGEQLAQELTQALGPYWRGRVRRLELISKALSAMHLFLRDEHYLLRDGKVQIIDQYTGRVMPDRSWERGLHQLIEMKEGCELSKPRETLEKISYQRFFRLYHHLAGMTGTAGEVRGECWQVYHLPVITIPTHKRSRRVEYPTTLVNAVDDKWPAIVAAVQSQLQQHRAVLIGTGSVAASETLSGYMAAQGIEHQVLNARQDADEADIVAQAGQAGKVTISTSMAGRGTDIKLVDSVEAAGGLHVILSELQDSSRVDRQLQGRCARMGDPGSVEFIVSLQDGIAENLSGLWRWLLNRIAANKPNDLHDSNHDPGKNASYSGLRRQLGLFLLKRAQRRVEQRQKAARAGLLKADQRQGELLAFAGKRV